MTNKRGRPSKLTPDQKGRIVALAAEGRVYTEIAKELGINHGSVKYWLTVAPDVARKKDISTQADKIPDAAAIGAVNKEEVLE